MTEVESILYELKEKLKEFEEILNKSQKLENSFLSNSINLSNLSLTIFVLNYNCVI